MTKLTTEVQKPTNGKSKTEENAAVVAAKEIINTPNPELRFFMLIKERLLFSLKSGQRRKLGKKEILISAAF